MGSFFLARVMSESPPDGEVVLSEGRSALAALHAALVAAATAFPAALGDVGIPASARELRRVYPDLLPRFEAARLASEARAAIGRCVLDMLYRQIAWQDADGQRPLAQALREEVAPLPLQTQAFSAAPAWQPSVTYRGRRWGASQLGDLGALLTERGAMTEAAARALAWLAGEVLDEGAVRLSGRKIAVLGAGAEMASTWHWLQAGADILWLDVRPPPRSWWESSRASGRLFWPIDNIDLLAQPRQALATLSSFADGAPLDIALFAYAPGRARELRLSAAMNAIVDAYPGMVASVTMLVSPTTPTGLAAEDRQAMSARLAERPAWEACCARLGLLGRGGGAAVVDASAATRTVVAIQGASYQAAQYVCKILAAECWARQASDDVIRKAMRVSANTAAITRTRSLMHPVFAAAFGGATALGVETLAPGQSRQLNGLLAVHDWLHPQPPVPGRLRVHGGIHSLPYPLAAALRIAATIGFARSPRLLRGLLGGRR